MGFKGTAAVLLVAVALALAGCATAADFPVTWQFPSAFSPALTAYPNLNVAVGDTVTFKWSSNHNVWQTPSAACPASFVEGPGLTQKAAASASGTYTFRATAPGTYFFACGVSTHCANGNMKIAVVVAASAPGSAPIRGPALAPGPARILAPAPAPVRAAPGPAPGPRRAATA
ncbi:hypothetical protein WJX72_004280 [[Myrmecia] bisecta]|uniref:Phytocyanin domain-containing protein n=1 Tax=[Myrmecia] bisecta TaxID=41462 RepID=A0AAW1R6A5_9CHLO